MMIATALAGALLAAGLAAPARAEAPAAGAVVPAIRGETPAPSTTHPPRLPRQKIQEGSFERTWKQQPPLIPHRMDKYEIDLKVNQCLGCHDRGRTKESGATEISKTHYRDREGREIDRVSRARWFCTQCHVPQNDISPQVQNTFEGAR